MSGQVKKPHTSTPTHQPLPHQPAPHDSPNLHSPKKLLSKSWQVILLAIIGAVLLVMTTTFIWFFISITSVVDDVPVNGQIIEVSQGESLEGIASELTQKKLIGNGLAFILFAKFGPAHGQLIPGPYLIRPTSSIMSIIADMAAGKTAVDKITYPEGITREDMAKRFENAGYGSKQDYLNASVELAQKYDFIPSTAKQNPEGFLFPATYEFKSQSPASTLITMQYEQFKSDAWPLLQQGGPQKLSPYQLLILASIVEHEGTNLEDRKLIAGVFYNRLSRAMKLESDVTINYITGRKATTPADLKINSPYNSYLNNGLPPTPVNNPGIESIKAVVSPTSSNYIFFIGGKDGKVYFAENLPQHNENIKNHL